MYYTWELKSPYLYLIMLYLFARIFIISIICNSYLKPNSIFKFLMKVSKLSAVHVQNNIHSTLNYYTQENELILRINVIHNYKKTSKVLFIRKHFHKHFQFWKVDRPKLNYFRIYYITMAYYTDEMWYPSWPPILASIPFIVPQS